MTCTGCHLSPAGGGLLSENGFLVAESESWKGGDPRFLHGVSLADWLQLGGDVRGAAGAVDNGALGGAAYPMQAEVHASAGARGFTFNATGGLRRPQDGGSVIHALWSREHYVMWQQKPGTTEGLYVRAGRFMPVYGLRLAEHIAYTQRFGGEPLYGEAYGAAVEYVTTRFEVHATGFVHDSIGSAVEHGDGGALYAEARIGEHAAVGAEAKYAGDDDQHRTYLGLTGKVYVPNSKLLFQAEAEIVHNSLVSGGSYDQLLGQLLATRPLAQAWVLDVGIGHYTQDTAVKGNYRESIDVNVHWFVTSHLEALATMRLELVDAGGGTNGGYALAQIHYRL
ncbi:MAG: hypothetical protein ABI867_29060 [Kofleriaceae bacterium]